ncbi:RnfABCDGE type electron transport complex subunit G [Petroclostridium sp. X23]|uniref:RnfABCDGE type electron transport complex subunit G n=1 Tax=Petroclostridium sp. X23 TaxID=3045146 RepID=UPI0024ACEBD7|nr:RnfABCDGE type electron transport complex subunit G [Petroclostridium sp. X23]WHH59992.1 RnfABCDGE type electron transport complex subunit G [Petroclostridium sp. X23]
MHKGLRLIIVLGVIALLSGGILAKTYEITAPTMREVALENQKKAIFEVLPEIKDYREFNNDQGLLIYEGLDDSGNVAGLAFVAEGGGFQGVIRMMVGIDLKNKKMTGYKVLEHLETPGLGARITEDGFKKQFSDKSLNDAFAIREDIIPITGATISSNAVSKILKESIDKTLAVYGGEAK